jgi:hypothetical protein
MFYNKITHHLWARRGALFLVALALAFTAQLTTAQSAAASTYYISPNGSDSNSGTSTDSAWKSFKRAWQTLQPGDTLLVMDGTYTEPLQPNVRNGQPGSPITIKAVNDGQAVIDGQGREIPIRIGENWGPNGMVGDWYVLEGLVARNGGLSAIRIEKGNHNVLRRMSAYDASPDDNSATLGILWSNDNLVEDCVVAGTGRYMIDIFSSSGNTVRRCFTQWERWDGRNFCGVTWPNGNNVGVYNSSNTTVENVIAYGRALTGIFIQANSDSAVANNNQILGSMALLQGRNYDDSVWTYGSGQDQPTSRPGPTSNPYGPACDGHITQWKWGNHRTGFNLWGQGQLQDNVFRDVLASGNVGVGLGAMHPAGPGSVRTTIDHATLLNNGSSVPDWEGKQGGNVYIERGDVTVTNSRIANSQWASQGEGARFQFRYVDRQLTDQPLWPWPMEDRIKRELGVSVNEVAAKYADTYGFSMAVNPGAWELERNASTEVTVQVTAFGKFAKPVNLHATGLSAGLRIDTPDGTVTAPGEWKFRVTAPDASGAYEVRVTAKAEGVSEIQRTVVIMVDPQKLFLPAISSRK